MPIKSDFEIKMVLKIVTALGRFPVNYSIGGGITQLKIRQITQVTLFVGILIFTLTACGSNNQTESNMDAESDTGAISFKLVMEPPPIARALRILQTVLKSTPWPPWCWMTIM